MSRLRVVSNFGDGDCGAGKIHTRAREISRRRDAFGAPFASRLLELSRARVYILPAPQSQSPKLETIRSLKYEVKTINTRYEVTNIKIKQG